MSNDEPRTESATGQRDRRYHGGAPERLDDDELARRTEAERAGAGVTGYDPDAVPAATDEPVPYDPDADAVVQDIESAAARREAEGENVPPGPEHPFPPTRYAE
jgi:hypothetical protein